MDGYEFSVSMSQAWAWPITTLLLALILKNHLTLLLKRIKEGKFKLFGTEWEFTVNSQLEALSTWTQQEFRFKQETRPATISKDQLDVVFLREIDRARDIDNTNLATRTAYDALISWIAGMMKHDDWRVAFTVQGSERLIANESSNEDVVQALKSPFRSAMGVLSRAIDTMPPHIQNESVTEKFIRGTMRTFEILKQESNASGD